MYVATMQANHGDARHAKGAGQTGAGTTRAQDEHALAHGLGFTSSSCAARICAARESSAC